MEVQELSHIIYKMRPNSMQTNSFAQQPYRRQKLHNTTLLLLIQTRVAKLLEDRRAGRLHM
jgi:hypothetical protein